MIGQFLRLSPWLRDNVQLVTHITLLGNDLDRLSYDYLQYVSVWYSHTRASTISVVLARLFNAFNGWAQHNR
jgi:hypothetical protein